MNRAAHILAVGTMVLASLLPLTMADEADHAAPQTLCPVMEGNAIDKSIHVDYQGKRVFFCCMFCKTAFQETPEKYLSKLPQFSDVPEHHAEETTHDHALDHETDDGGGSRLSHFLGKFHPIAVHLPIALVLVAALAEFLAMITQKDSFERISRFNIDIAVLGAAASVGLGLLAGLSANYSGEFERPFLLHKWLGIATGVFIVVAAILSELVYRRRTPAYRWSYRAVLLLCVGLVGGTGYFGGQLVYGLNHYAW